MGNIVHVVGTGTIGEPLIGLLADDREAFGIDEVTFHKRTPAIEERAKVRDLERRGAVLAVDEDRRSSFEELGFEPTRASQKLAEWVWADASEGWGAVRSRSRCAPTTATSGSSTAISSRSC